MTGSSALKKLSKQPNEILPMVFEPVFPTHALGDILGKAANDIAYNAQSPVAMAGQSVLTATALVAQAFANVSIDGREYPLSLFGLTIASSGDRKTTTDKIALKPILEHQKNLMNHYAIAQKEHSNKVTAYHIAKRNITKELDTSEQTDIVKALEQLDEVSPPSNPKFICSEPTIEGLHKSYQNGRPAQGIFNDEAGQFFSGHSMSSDSQKIKTITALSRLWDGATIERTRSSRNESLYLSNRRLSAHFMLQPVIAERLMKDQELFEQGFLARFLIVAPESLAGKRQYRELSHRNYLSINQYYKLITKLLNTGININSHGELQFKTIKLSKPAKYLWVAVYNKIEQQLGKNGAFHDIQPFANKVCENIIRIAGVFAVIEQSHIIDKQQMQRAIELGFYYLDSFRFIRTKASDESIGQRADILYQWLLKSKHLDKNGQITIAKILQNSPKSINARSKSQAFLLLKALVEKELATIINTEKSPSVLQLLL